jgi:predicted GNAT family acetyltransferase
MSWQVARAGSAEEFSALAGPFLSRHPVESNVALTLLAAALDRRFPFGEPLWLLVRDPDGEVAGAALRTGELPLLLPPVPGPAVEALVDWLATRLPDLPGVNGVLADAQAFAAGWLRRTGRPARTAMAERMHALRAVRPPIGVPGRARPAGPQDLDLVVGWMLDFEAEAGLLSTPEQVRRLTPERVASGTLRLWDDSDGQPVALAGWHRPAHGVGRVGPVYTPPEHRNQGYGSAVAADATQAVLAAGAEQAMLYTDLANPVSNAIYARLGYAPVCDAAILSFG